MGKRWHEMGRVEDYDSPHQRKGNNIHVASLPVPVTMRLCSLGLPERGKHHNPAPNTLSFFGQQEERTTLQRYDTLPLSIY